MSQIVQLGESDSYALTLGRLLMQGYAAALNLDMTNAQLQKLQEQLDRLEEQLNPRDNEDPSVE